MPELTATYTPPTSSSESPQTFSHALPTLSSEPSTADRTASLSALQTSIRVLQADINTFLTRKMDEEKAAGAEKMADVAEEENYGEEVADTD